MSALMTSVVPLGGDDEATDPVPDRGTPGDRGGNRGSTQGGRERGTASHGGRVGGGPLRPREPAVGPGRDRRTARPDRAARSRTITASGAATSASLPGMQQQTVARRWRRTTPNSPR